MQDKLTDMVKTLDIDLFKDTWRKSFILAGRANRQEFWNFQVFMGAFSIVATIIYLFIPNDFLACIFIPLLMASIVPSFSLGVRRCHDLNLSGIFVVTTLIPVVGPFIYYGVMGFMPSQNEGNNYNSSGVNSEQKN